jgi:hypothetical protein
MGNFVANPISCEMMRNVQGTNEFVSKCILRVINGEVCSITRNDGEEWHFGGDRTSSRRASMASRLDAVVAMLISSAW